MLLPLQEYYSSNRYVWVDPSTHKVQLFVPVVGGNEISTDNTCKSTQSLREFFEGGAALRELKGYQSRLIFDLQILDAAHPLKKGKQQRLKQIEQYIKSIERLKEKYWKIFLKIMDVPSNLYAIQLRPTVQDPASHSFHPVFSVDRSNDLITGAPLSRLYLAMHTMFPYAIIAPVGEKARLKQKVAGESDFEQIQRILAEECLLLFQVEVNFYLASDGKQQVTRKLLDDVLGVTPDQPATSEEYVDALLRLCAPALFEFRMEMPFYEIADNRDKAEKLSILTQFFLAHVTIYCAVNDISHKNLGAVFDASAPLSESLVTVVTRSLRAGAMVEDAICGFFNNYADLFGMSRLLMENDILAIKQKFKRTYAQIDQAGHKDDFMILDMDAVQGKFVVHQGAICVNFTEFEAVYAPTPRYLTFFSSEKPRRYASHIPSSNQDMLECISMSAEALLSRIKDYNQLCALPDYVIQDLRKSPLFVARVLLNHVAQGKQNEARQELVSSADAQLLLCTAGTFTDYSGRTFHCTAYEYAYWAKDTYMRRMFLEHMDEHTRQKMLVLCEEIEKNGLEYIQNGKKIRSKHFDFGPLIQALVFYTQNYAQWHKKNDIDKMSEASMNIGKAQRDLPVNVINEYCRKDRLFDPLPSFKEYSLPRSLSFYNVTTNEIESVFPLAISSTYGLGVDILLCSQPGGVKGVTMAGISIRFDLAAIRQLDKVRTQDLEQSLASLRYSGGNYRIGM